MEIAAQNNEIIELSTVNIKCPVCGKNKNLNFPRSVINQAKRLTTISIPKGLVCKHHFQAFIDKNFVVRGYQKVDFEYAKDLIKSKKSKQKENEFYEYIIIEENYRAYKSKENKIIIERNEKINERKEKFDNNMDIDGTKYSTLRKDAQKPKTEELNINLKNIYDEFWDFIDQNNKEFQEFIRNDPRHANLTSNY